MFLYYEVRGMNVTLINTCATFDHLYKVAREKAISLLEPDSRKEFEERLQNIDKEYHRIEYGRHTMSIHLEVNEFKYDTNNYYLHVKELPSRLKDEEYFLFHVSTQFVSTQLMVTAVSNDFIKLYEKAVDMTLEDLSEYSSEANHNDYKQFFDENKGKEVFEHDSYNEGVYVNIKHKYYQYWTRETEDYLVIVDKLPKAYKRVVL